MSDLAWVFEAPKASAAQAFEAPSVSIVSSAFAPMNVKLQNVFQAPGRSKMTDERPDEQSDPITTLSELNDLLGGMFESVKKGEDVKIFLDKTVANEETSNQYPSKNINLLKPILDAVNAKHESNTVWDTNQIKDEVIQTMKQMEKDSNTSFAGALSVQFVQSSLRMLLAAKNTYTKSMTGIQQLLLSDNAQAFRRVWQTFEDNQEKEETLTYTCTMLVSLHNWFLMFCHALEAALDQLNNSEDAQTNQQTKRVLEEWTTSDQENESLAFVLRELREILTNDSYEQILKWCNDFKNEIVELQKRLDRNVEHSHESLNLVKITGELPSTHTGFPSGKTVAHYTFISKNYNFYDDNLFDTMKKTEEEREVKEENLEENEPLNQELHTNNAQWNEAFGLVRDWNRTENIDESLRISMYRKQPSNKKIIIQSLRSEYERMVETLMLNDYEHMNVEEQMRHQELVDLFRTVAAFEAEVREMSDNEADKGFQVQLGNRSELLQAFKEIDSYEKANAVKRHGTADGKIQFVELYGFLTRKDTDAETNILKEVRNVLKKNLDETKGEIQNQIVHLFHDVMDVDKDSNVDAFEFLRYMVLAKHSHQDLQDNLKGLTTVTGHLMDHSEVLKNIAEKHKQLHEEFETYKGILNRLDEFFYNPKKWRSQNKTMLQELEQFTQMFNNGVKFCNLVGDTYVDVNGFTNIQARTNVFKALNTYMNDVIFTILKPISLKAIVHMERNVPVMRDKFERTTTKLLFQEQIKDMSKQTKRFMSLLNEMRKSEVSIDSMTTFQQALEDADQVVDEMDNFHLTQAEVSTKIEETKKELVNLKEKVEEIVADTTQSPSKKEDLEEKIKKLNKMDTKLRTIATAIATDETDTHEETEKLKESIKDQIQQERDKREEEIANIKAKEEAAANTQRQAEQEEADKKAREAEEAEKAKEAKEAQVAQDKFDTEIGEITSKFNHNATKIESEIVLCQYPWGNLDAVKTQVEEATKELEKLREEQLQRFKVEGKDDGGQFEGWKKDIDDITKNFEKAEKQFQDDVKKEAQALKSDIEQTRRSVETLESSHTLNAYEILVGNWQTKLEEKTRIASTNYKQFESLFDEARSALDLAQTALNDAKERFESEKIENAKRLQEAEDEKQRVSQAKKEAEEAKANFAKKSNENEGKFFGLADDIREAIRGREVNLDELKSQLDDALPRLEQLLKDQTALYLNAKEPFHFAKGWREIIDELETNYGKKMEIFVEEVKYTTENLQDDITSITSELVSLQDENMTADKLGSLVSKLEGKFQAIQEEIEREEAKAKQISKEAGTYFSSIHRQLEAAQNAFEMSQELAKAQMEARKTDKRESASSNDNPESTRGSRIDEKDVEFGVSDDTVKETDDKKGRWFQTDIENGKQEKESPLVKEPTDEPTKKPTETLPKTDSNPPQTSQDDTLVVHSLGFMEANGFHLLSGYAEHYLSHVKHNDLKHLELYECDGVYLWYANDKTRTPAWNLLALMNTLLTKYNGWDCSGRCWRISTGARRAQRLFSPWCSYGRMAQILLERDWSKKPLNLISKAFQDYGSLIDDLEVLCSFERLKHVKNPKFQEVWQDDIMSKVEPLVPKNTNTDYTELNTRIQSASCMVIGAGYNEVVDMGKEFGRLERNFPNYVGFADSPNHVKGPNVILTNHPDMTLDPSKTQEKNAQRAINYVNGVWDTMQSSEPKGFDSAVIDRCVQNACAQAESDSTVMIWHNRCYAEEVIDQLLSTDRPIFFTENYARTSFNDIIFRMTARKAFPNNRVFFGLDSVTSDIDFDAKDFLFKLYEDRPVSNHILDDDLWGIDAKEIPKSTYSIHCARYNGRNPVELYDKSESNSSQSKHQRRMQIDSQFEKEVIRKKEFEAFCQRYQSHVQKNQRDESDNHNITKPTGANEELNSLIQAHTELDELRARIREADKNKDRFGAIKLYIEYLTQQKSHFKTFTGKDPEQFDYYMAINTQGFSYAVVQAELLITEPPKADVPKADDFDKKETEPSKYLKYDDVDLNVKSLVKEKHDTIDRLVFDASQEMRQIEKAIDLTNAATTSHNDAVTQIIFSLDHVEELLQLINIEQENLDAFRTKLTSHFNEWDLGQMAYQDEEKIRDLEIQSKFMKQEFVPLYEEMYGKSRHQVDEPDIDDSIKQTKIDGGTDEDSIDLKEQCKTYVSNFITKHIENEDPTIQSELKKHDLTIRSVKGDGYCLFYALQDQLNQQLPTDQQWSVKNLKETLVEYILHNMENELKSDLNDSSSPLKSIDDFRQVHCSVRNPKEYREGLHGRKFKKPAVTWGSDIFLDAASRIFQKKVNLYQAGLAMDTRYGARTYSEQSDDDAISIVFNGVHYDSVAKTNEVDNLNVPFSVQYKEDELYDLLESEIDATYSIRK